jgi:hypothetical protein
MPLVPGCRTYSSCSSRRSSSGGTLPGRISPGMGPWMSRLLKHWVSQIGRTYQEIIHCETFGTLGFKKSKNCTVCCDHELSNSNSGTIKRVFARTQLAAQRVRVILVLSGTNIVVRDYPRLGQRIWVFLASQKKFKKKPKSFPTRSNKRKQMFLKGLGPVWTRRFLTVKKGFPSIQF